MRGYAWAAGGLALTAAAVAAALASSTASGRPGALSDGTTAAGVGLLVGAVAHESQGPEQPGRSASATWRAFRQGLTTHRVLLAGLLLVLGQAVLRVKVGAGCTSGQDDFLHLDLSRTLGLSRDYLVRDYSGHVEPAQYLVIWAVGQLGQGSFVPAVVVLVGLQALASTLLLAAAAADVRAKPVAARPRSPAYLFTPLGLATATWGGGRAAGLSTPDRDADRRLHRTGETRADCGAAAGGRCPLPVTSWAWSSGRRPPVLPALLAVELLVLSAGLPLRERGPADVAPPGPSGSPRSWSRSG